MKAWELCPNWHLCHDHPPPKPPCQQVMGFSWHLLSHCRPCFGSEVSTGNRTCKVPRRLCNHVTDGEEHFCDKAEQSERLWALLAHLLLKWVGLRLETGARAALALVGVRWEQATPLRTRAGLHPLGQVKPECTARCGGCPLAIHGLIYTGEKARESQTGHFSGCGILVLRE